MGVTTTTSLPDEPGPWLIFDKGDLGGSEYEERALPGIGRPFREPNPDFPPNHNVVEAMSDPQVQKMVKDVTCADCSDIAAYLYKEAGQKGAILNVKPALRNNLNVLENGVLEKRQTYHQVYSDGQYVYDPRVSSRPVPQGDWLQLMKGTNPDGISISKIK
ncbi:hypothetical protein IB259_09595 [Achromobacter sp. ACM04]|uniref:hypothetical protein n=1 Tax=Achromobacter TaxID=222 RepID=UPI00158228DB|nr:MULTISPECIES: hypothetical protein [Achromobacter]MBD9419508.1 hypothetical protein [Achromobacter sp. ACM04]